MENEIKFEVDDANSDEQFKVWVWEDGFDGQIRIVKHLYSDWYSVFAKLFQRDEAEGYTDGCIEVSSSKAKTFEEAEEIAYKLWKICLDYKVPGPGKE